jgi:hypothetical protein
MTSTIKISLSVLLANLVACGTDLSKTEEQLNNLAEQESVKPSPTPDPIPTNTATEESGHPRSMVNNKKGVDGSAVVIRTWMIPESSKDHDLDDAEDSKMGTERGMITEYANGDVLVNFIVKHETKLVDPTDPEDTDTVRETIPINVFAPCSQDRKGDFYELSKRKIYVQEYLKELSYAVLYSCKYEEVYLVLDVNQNGKIAFDYFNDSLADQHLYGGAWKVLTFQREQE